jgi:DNA replication and repair protein RecF
MRRNVPSLSRLRLTRFRSYLAADLRFGGGVVAFTGPNGAGKTNILEAISLLAPGRGLRGARIAEVAMHGAPSWAVSGHFADAADGFEVGTGSLEEAGPERRAFRLDGEKLRSQAELAERLAVVWLTPQMDRLFGEPPSGRRRFLDRLVLALEPAHAAQVSRYETAMSNRNRLLAEGGADPAGWTRWRTPWPATAWRSPPPGASWWRGWAPPWPAASPVHSRPPASPCSARRPTLLDTMPALAAEDALRQGWRESRARDAGAGATLVGPHRADLAFTHVGKEMPANLCSTGEQKALLVSTVLAHAGLVGGRRDLVPLLLLDEVAAHLDGERRVALLAALGDLPVQSFLTGTERENFPGNVENFRVENGAVTLDPLP